jgi:hypothetical protein
VSNLEDKAVQYVEHNGNSISEMKASTETTFAQATAVKQQSSHEYLGDFPDDWCIGTGKRLNCYFTV